MINLLTLRNDSSFAVQFSNSVSKSRAILLFTIKIIQMFELHASMPSMQSVEYLVTIPPKFLIITHNYWMFRQSTWIKITIPRFRVVVTSLDGFKKMTWRNWMKFRLYDLIMSLKQREKFEPRIILKQFTQKYLNRKFIPINNQSQDQGCDIYLHSAAIL